MGNYKKISDILPNVLKKLKIKKQIEQYKALPIWEEVVGKAISINTKPLFIKNGILFVLVDDPIWHQELELLKNQILDKINEKIEIKLAGIKFIQRRW